MLKTFKAGNFKSFRHAEFNPTGSNLIVGTNNAGKTNLCQALLFVGLSSRLPLEEAARACTSEPWNLLNVYTESDTAEFDVQATVSSRGEQFQYFYRLSVSGPKSVQSSSKSVSRPFRVEYEHLRVTGDSFRETTLLENKAGSVRLLHEKRYLQRENLITSPDSTTAYVQTSAPTDATMLYRLFDLETNRLANIFKRYLSSWTYYDFDPVRLRSSSASPMDQELRVDGSNLSSVLYTLHNEQPRDEKKIIDAVRLLEPRLDLISFRNPDPDHVYMFFEDKGAHRFGVHNISDGTLRFLAMCYLIIANRRGNPDDPVPLVMLEEPENGVYVGHLKPLFDKVDPSGNDGQFVFTSHNPYFIDLFDSNPKGVHVVHTEGDQSVIRQPDPKRLIECLGTFSLGEMHFRGLLQ